MKKIFSLCLSVVIMMSLIVIDSSYVKANSYDENRIYTITRSATPDQAVAYFNNYVMYAQSNIVKVDLRDAQEIPDSAIIKKVWVEFEKSISCVGDFYDYNLMLTYLGDGDYTSRWQESPMKYPYVASSQKAQMFGFEDKKVKDCWYMAFNCKTRYPMYIGAMVLRKFKIITEYTDGKI